MRDSINAPMLPLFTARINFKARVRVDAPDPAKVYQFKNLARQHRKSAVAMQITKALQVERHWTGLSNGQLWSALFATLEPVTP